MGAQPLNDSLYRIVGRMIGLSLAHGGSLAIAGCAATSWAATRSLLFGCTAAIPVRGLLAAAFGLGVGWAATGGFWGFFGHGGVMLSESPGVSAAMTWPAFANLPGLGNFFVPLARTPLVRGRDWIPDLRRSLPV